ncbi:hypothetical protein D7Z26_07285 [Cohnella endophytica]|uniref:Uncharacterized protein n=1 Tax=Cohnella endophytica TaxID=2419778 RepID=A0A494Y424_9BACL|nr:GerAB/ArcD/ProY family transporter [Cohnella endophytica]RKP55026.1 hypothetical protein D7Z26_07285 [Cohnella endophytica]
MTKRMIFILFLQIQLSAALSFYTVGIFESTTKGHWEPILAGCLLEIVFLWIYLKGLSMSKGKNMVEIIKGTFGKWGAMLILLPFFLFLVTHLISLVNHQVSEVNIILLPQTPLWMTAMIYVALAAYAANKGVLVIARMSTAVLLLFVPFVLFSLLISYKNFDMYNVFPLWNPSFSFVGKPSFYVSMYAYAGFLFLGMLNLDKPIKLRKMWLVLSLVVLFYLAVVYVPLFVFGHESITLLIHPTLLASDTIDLEWVVFDWLPSFFVVAASALSFLDAAVTLWMAILLIRVLLFPIPGKWLALTMGIAVFGLSLKIPNMHSMNRFDAMITFLFLYGILVVPVATVISSMRQRRRQT